MKTNVILCTKTLFVCLILLVCSCQQSLVPLITSTNVQTETLASGLTTYLVGQSYNGNPYNIWGWTDVSIAVDASNQVHIIYRDENTKLCYAKKNDSGWIFKNKWPLNGVDLIDYNGTGLINYSIFGGNNCLVLDSSGNVYISCSANDGGDEDLLYITNKSGKWQTFGADVENEQSVGLNNSLALDSKGLAHISYYYWNKSALRYATNESGQWKFYTFDDTEVLESQIGVDSHDIIHIVYSSASNNVWHLSKTNGVWNKEKVPTGEYNDWYPILSSALAFDKDDNLYIFGLDGLNIKRGNVWEHQSIFTEMFPNLSAYQLGVDQQDITIDSNGKIHVCFYLRLASFDDVCMHCDDYGEFIIYYASNSTGVWKAWPIDYWSTKNCSPIANPRLALDAADNVHLVYTKSDDWKVRYVTFNIKDLSP